MSGAAATLRQRVLNHLRKCGSHGATREEMEDALSMKGNTLRPRCAELEARGLIQAAWFTRPTKSNRQAEVLVTTGLGEE
jgi:hypothetical protein